MSEGIELRPLSSSSSSSTRNAPPIPPRHPETSNTLHSAYRAAEEKAKAAVNLQEGGLDNISVWGIVVSSWFAILALPLLLFPRLLLFFAQVPPQGSSSFSTTSSSKPNHDHYDTLSPLESFLSLSLSFGLITLSLISLLILVPTYQPPHTNPSRLPLLGILVGLISLMSVIGWDTKRIGGLGFVVGIGCTGVAVWGWWVVVFGRGDSRLGSVGKGSKKMPERFRRL